MDWSRKNTPRPLGRKAGAGLALLVGTALLASHSAPAAAEHYAWSLGPVVADIQYSGLSRLPRQTFLDVYCIDLPDDVPATGSMFGMLGNNAISFYRATYSGGLNGYVVTSTVPEERSAADEFALQLERERRTEALFAPVSTIDRYRVELGQAAWGPVLGVRIINIREISESGPFPVARMLLDDEQQLYTMSVHRIFTRGGDRFEIAALGTPGVDESADALDHRLSSLADAMVQSLQACTSAMDVGLP